MMRRVVAATLLAVAVANREAKNNHAVTLDEHMCDEGKTAGLLEYKKLTKVFTDGPGVFGHVEFDEAFNKFVEAFQGRPMDLAVIRTATQQQRLKMVEKGSVTEMTVLQLGALKVLAEEELYDLAKAVDMQPSYIMILLMGGALTPACMANSEQCMTTVWMMGKLAADDIKEDIDAFVKHSKHTSGDTAKEQAIRSVVATWATSKSGTIVNTQTKKDLLKQTSYFHCQDPIKTHQEGRISKVTVTDWDTTEHCSKLLDGLEELDDKIEVGTSVNHLILNKLSPGSDARIVLEYFGYLSGNHDAYDPPEASSDKADIKNKIDAAVEKHALYKLPAKSIKRMIVKGYLDSKLCSYAKADGAVSSTFALSDDDFGEVVRAISATTNLRDRSAPSECIKLLVEQGKTAAPNDKLSVWCGFGVLKQEHLKSLARGCKVGAATLAAADADSGSQCQFGKDGDGNDLFAAFQSCADSSSAEWKGKDILDLHFGKLGRVVQANGAVKTATFNTDQLLAMKVKFSDAEKMELVLREAIDGADKKKTFLLETVGSDAAKLRFFYTAQLLGDSDVTSAATHGIMNFKTRGGGAKNDEVSTLFESYCSQAWRTAPNLISSDAAVPSMCSPKILERLLSAVQLWCKDASSQVAPNGCYGSDGHLTPGIETYEVGMVADKVAAETMYKLRLYLNGGLCSGKGESCDIGAKRYRTCAWMFRAEQPTTSGSFGFGTAKATHCLCDGLSKTEVVAPQAVGAWSGTACTEKKAREYSLGERKSAAGKYCDYGDGKGSLKKLYEEAAKESRFSTESSTYGLFKCGF